MTKVALTRSKDGFGQEVEWGQTSLWRPQAALWVVGVPLGGRDAQLELCLKSAKEVHDRPQAREEVTHFQDHHLRIDLLAPTAIWWPQEQQRNNNNELRLSSVGGPDQLQRGRRFQSDSCGDLDGHF